MRNLKLLQRRLRGWFAPVLPPAWTVALALTYPLALQAIIWWFESIANRNPDFADADLMLRYYMMRNVYLGALLGAYGFYRAVSNHPAYSPPYAEWLRQMPWRNGLPLPLGPVAFVAQDGLILLVVWLWTNVGYPLEMGVAVALLFAPYLIGQASPMWEAGEKARVCAVGLLLAAAVWLRPASLLGVCFIMAAYVTMLLGMPKSLRAAIAGTTGSQPSFVSLLRRMLGHKPPAETWNARLGFPYSALSPNAAFLIHDRFSSSAPRVDATESGAPPPWNERGELVSLQESILIAANAGAWCYALAGYAPLVFRADLTMQVAKMGLVLAIFFRFVVYVAGFLPPISIWGRIANRMWIVPGYDRVLIPLLGAGAPLAALMTAQNLGLESRQWLAPIALAIGWFIVLAMPPTWLNWALTGEHRLSAGAKTRGEFVEI